MRYTSYDQFLPKDVIYGGYVAVAPYLRDQMPTNTPFWEASSCFETKHGKYLNFCTIKASAAIPNKSCRMIKISSLHMLTKMCPTNPR